MKPDTQPIDRITVRAHANESTRGRLKAANLKVECALGRGGISRNKREGDGITPAGAWQLREVFFRPDRISRPATALPVSAITPGDGWCDDPASQHYNRKVRLPFEPGHEVLWRGDHLYDVVVVLGFNDDPVIPGAGSAIFFHLAKRDYAPTEGCVAVNRGDMLAILEHCGPETVMQIDAG